MERDEDQNPAMPLAVQRPNQGTGPLVPPPLPACITPPTLPLHYSVKVLESLPVQAALVPAADEIKSKFRHILLKVVTNCSIAEPAPKEDCKVHWIQQSRVSWE